MLSFEENDYKTELSTALFWKKFAKFKRVNDYISDPEQK